MTSLLVPSVIFSNKPDGENRRINRRYAIVIEKALTNYAAYVPDLPGCVATGTTIDETETLIREAIALHIEGLQADGQPLPPSNSQVEYREVSV